MNVRADPLWIASEERTEGEPAVPRRHVPPGPEGTSGPTGKSRLPYFFLFWELSVSGVEASSSKVELLSAPTVALFG